MEEKTKLKYELKKQLAHLKAMKGSGTELISVYIPSEQAIHETSNKLRGEAGQATNIKSKGTRKNVVDALERILHHLKSYGNVAPHSGVAIFCGNVSDNPAKVVIELFTIYPPEPIMVQIYRCDSRFFLEPLERTLEVTDSYGLVVLDGRECTLAELRGTNTRILHRLNSTAHAKIRKGGQCLAPDTMVQMSDGTLARVGDVAAGSHLKGADLSEFSIGDWQCSDRFETRSKSAYKIVAHAPKMEIVATAWHRFFTIGENGVRETYAKDLKIGDRVLVAKKIHHDGKDVEIRYKPETRISLDEGEYESLRFRRSELGWPQSKVAKKLGITQMAICRMERGEIPLSAGKIRQMYALYGLKLDEKKFAAPALKLPATYTPRLAYLLGVIAGDGTLDGNRVIIYESYNQMVEKYSRAVLDAVGIIAVCRKVDKTGQKGSFAKKPYYELRIYSKEFADFVAGEVPQILAASDERCVPVQIQCSPLQVQAAFLSGLYDAEGYLHGKRVEIAMRSEKMMRQVQSILLRFGIRASFSQKTVAGNPQWCTSISDSASLAIFSSEIGFSRKDKSDALQDIMHREVKMQFVEQVPVDGREVFAFARSLGLSTSDFHAASNFFRNKKPLGRAAFRKNIEGVLLSRARTLGKEGIARKVLAKWLSNDIGVARVAEKIPITGEREYVDLTVPNAFNFVANGFIVHNSARRYERLIEESIELYYKRIGEYMDKYFVNSVKGVIIGGPGPAKDDFFKMSPFNYQIKVLGVVDTGYTDEYGVREVMAKSTDILSEQQAIRERVIVERFIKEVVAGGLATYGEAEVRKALESKQAKELLISEGVAYKRAKLVDTTTLEAQYVTSKTPFDLAEKIKAIGGTVKVESEVSLVDDLISLADRQGIDIFVVSPDTAEGAQFLGSFYGIGAFLRYR
ncbi:MAG: helix-turn-helix domain-containing protein [Candidatus Micrarchaeota archaeon]|nr:helix-turn-helix domain-containing protein [Candidatus Micrarchaeota archaeon]